MSFKINKFTTDYGRKIVQLLISVGKNVSHYTPTPYIVTGLTCTKNAYLSNQKSAEKVICVLNLNNNLFNIWSLKSLKEIMARHISNFFRVCIIMYNYLATI